MQNVKQLALIVDADNSDLPALVRFTCRELIEQITRLTERLAVLDNEISRLSGEVARRLQTKPGVGPITALASNSPEIQMAQFRLKLQEMRAHRHPFLPSKPADTSRGRGQTFHETHFLLWTQHPQSRDWTKGVDMSHQRWGC